jgi:UDP-N-acetylmuramate dehydrogenase
VRASECTEREALLAPFTTFGVGGPAEELARPRTPEEAASLVARARKDGRPLRVLGAGSNVLVSDAGVRGMVLFLTGPPFKYLARTGPEVAQVGAGGRLSRLVAACADWGLTGAEGLAGIPGTVGGALCMNAGTRAEGQAPSTVLPALTGVEGEIGALVKRVWTLGWGGAPETLTAADCEFGYRSSALAGRIVLGAELELSRAEPLEVRTRMDALLARRRETQPRGVRTAGSVFRNPEGESAGRILDELGCKGLAQGGARVSPVHANFIEAGKGATASDIVWLIDEMCHRALEGRGVRLETEIELWGFE